MEMSASNQRLIREWDTSGGMEAHDCCGGGVGGEGQGQGQGVEEAGLYRQDTLIHVPRQKQTRRRRMAKFSAVALVVLLGTALVLVFTAVRGAPGQQTDNRAVDRQLATQPPSGHSYAQQQHSEQMNPRAMLTAPAGNNTVSANETYLDWENKSGTAFCLGGFNYSRGNLVVPKTGFYRIFVQITFESKEVPSCAIDVLKLSYRVSQWTKSYKKNVHLLSAVDTVKCKMKIWKKSLYTSGLFKLEADSKLRVSSDYHDYIVKGNEQQVFFGAEYLPQ